MKVSKVVMTVVLAGLVIGVGVTATAAFAQAENPPAFGANGVERTFFGRGPGRGPAGMLMLEDGDHPLHDYLVASFADALGLGESELETRLEAGETMMDIALSAGLSQEEAWDLMQTAHQAALEAAEADGVEFPVYAPRAEAPVGEWSGDCPMVDGSPVGRGGFGMHGYAGAGTSE
ncbi:MAG: hypothetical protein P8X64_16690 [Anaerolineales bacterium]